MKKEDGVTNDPIVSEFTSETTTPTPKRKRGRPPTQPNNNDDGETPQQRKKRGRKSTTSDVEATHGELNNTPESKRGRKKKTGTKNHSTDGSDSASRGTASNRKPSTKAGIAGTIEPDSYSYTDLFPGDEEQDEDVDAGDDDSEYAPSDEEMAHHLSSPSSRRRGAAAGTRRQTRSRATESHLEGSTDEDEIGESESEFDEDEEEEEDLTLERAELMNEAATNGAPVALFEDEGNQVQRDVYDFDAQSFLSNKVVSAPKKRASGAVSAAVGAGVTGGRVSGQVPARRVSRRNATGAAPSWGSNIYSALAASLRTRADLDAYSDFLKSTVLNQDFDRLIAELCKPSTQHANLFYGVSASLQSLMSRINDYDKVVELVHACVARPLHTMRHRVACLAPVIHQPFLGLNYLPMITTALSKLTETLDQEMLIKPVYPLDPDINLLALTNAALSDFGVSPSQYNLVTGSGNMGRFMPDIGQLIVPTELFNKLNDLISLPAERVYEVALSRAHQQTDESDIDISPIEPPDLQRLMIILNSEEVLLGMVLLDSWNEEDVPVSAKETVLDLTKVSPVDTVEVEQSDESKDDSIQNEVADVLKNVVNCAIAEASVENPFTKRFGRSALATLGPLHFMDAFLLKPNGRRDHLLLVAHKKNCYPPLKSVVDEPESFLVYSLSDEGHFLLERHGFAPDVPVDLEGVHTMDPEEVLDDQALLVVPDLLYDTLRKVMLRELIRCTGAPTTVYNSVKSDTFVAPLPVVQCTKFVVLDRVRRVPLALVFDSPVRLALQVFSDEATVHPFGVEASKQFDQLTPAELKNTEAAFKPTTSDYRLVTIGGLLYAMQIDEHRIVRRMVEIIPARSDPVFPHSRRPSVCAQSVVGDSQSCPASVQIVNDETNSSTVLPAFYYSKYDRKRYSGVIAGFTEQVCNIIFDLPIRVSLYDIMFRLGQKHMPELLARQHIEAAEAAAYAEAAANPHAPPPAPVPLPEHWGVCCMCSKELRSINGLLDHELRHVGLSRFRCVQHNTSFLDRRQWQLHISEMHSTGRTSVATALPRIGHAAQTDSGSEPEEEDEDVPGSGLLAGLTQVFSTGVLVGRMEAPQCEKCGDYFLNADVLTQHLDFCDGVSFSVRTPIPRAQKPAADESVAISEVDADETTHHDENGELKTGSSVCGMCGAQLSSREKILRHFTSYHLQCIVCNSVLRSLEELSHHYKKHVATETEAAPSSTPFVKPEAVPGKTDVDTETAPTKTLTQKLMTCDLCQHFCGTKYNYYYHQWSEHGVIHPSVGSADVVPQPRQLRQTNDREEHSYSFTGVRRIKCKFCGLVVRVTGKEYVEHLSEKHGVFADQEVICRICAELFESPEHLSVHLGETHAPSGEFANAGVQTVFRCNQCEFWGFSKGMMKHAREAHGDINPAMYECPHCYERFTDKRSWRTHMDKHNEGYSQRCIECGRAFRLRASLLHHIRTHHGDDQGPATCEYCGMTYPRRASLRYHIFRMHNQELQHECTMCQRRFRVENELRRHVKEMHSGAVRCEICHKVCNNLRCYAQHRQKHFRTRIYQCTDCQTTFKSKLAMKRHIRVEHLQLGPEKFECQICGKIVTQIGMHMLIHKEARFECEYCGKRFTKAAYYNEHFRIHLGEQPFECHICQKRFNKKSNLNVHLKFHEKHRDEEGNYLELKPRGRVSTMFGDALLTPADRAARQAAAAREKNQQRTMADAAVGSDLPAAFNCAAGPPGAAADAAARAIEMFGMDSALLNHIPISTFATTDSNDGEGYS